MADAIKIIRDDHREVEKLFKEYEALGDGAFKTKQALALKICELLTVHAEMEESLFYPQAEDIFGKEDDKMVEEAYAEHGVAKTLIAEIQALDPQDPQFDAKVKVLQENIEHHVKEEEEELLPQAKKEMPAEKLDDIGDEMERFKEEHLSE